MPPAAVGYRGLAKFSNHEQSREVKSEMVHEFDTPTGQRHLQGPGLQSLIFLVWVDLCQEGLIWCSGVIVDPSGPQHTLDTGGSPRVWGRVASPSRPSYRRWEGAGKGSAAAPLVCMLRITTPPTGPGPGAALEGHTPPAPPKDDLNLNVPSGPNTAAVPPEKHYKAGVQERS